MTSNCKEKCKFNKLGLVVAIGATLSIGYYGACKIANYNTQQEVLNVLKLVEQRLPANAKTENVFLDTGTRTVKGVFTVKETSVSSPTASYESKMEYNIDLGSLPIFSDNLHFDAKVTTTGDIVKAEEGDELSKTFTMDIKGNIDKKNEKLHGEAVVDRMSLNFSNFIESYAYLSLFDNISGDKINLTYDVDLKEKTLQTQASAENIELNIANEKGAITIQDMQLKQTSNNDGSLMTTDLSIKRLVDGKEPSYEEDGKTDYVNDIAIRTSVNSDDKNVSVKIGADLGEVYTADSEFDKRMRMSYDIDINNISKEVVDTLSSPDFNPQGGIERALAKLFTHGYSIDVKDVLVENLDTQDELSALANFTLKPADSIDKMSFKDNVKFNINLVSKDKTNRVDEYAKETFLALERFPHPQNTKDERHYVVEYNGGVAKLNGTDVSDTEDATEFDELEATFDKTVSYLGMLTAVQEGLSKFDQAQAQEQASSGEQESNDAMAVSEEGEMAKADEQTAKETDDNADGLPSDGDAIEEVAKAQASEDGDGASQETKSDEAIDEQNPEEEKK